MVKGSGYYRARLNQKVCKARGREGVLDLDQGDVSGDNERLLQLVLSHIPTNNLAILVVAPSKDILICNFGQLD